ncbi:DUF429 domain-containing protein [Geoglobus sp.]
MKFGGVDVGAHKHAFAIVDGRRARVVDSLDDVIAAGVAAVGIDAPLSLPQSGAFRECERKLLKMGIRLFPSGAMFFRRIAVRGMEIAELLRASGIEVYEVYPFASRVVLGIEPEADKRTKAGLQRIVASLGRYVDLEGGVRTHDDVDAIISALTVMLYKSGRGRLVEGRDGRIVIPDPAFKKF